MEIIDKISLYMDSHLALMSGASIVLLDVVMRIYPKGIPILELVGRLCNGVGSLLVKVSSLFPNKKP